MTSNNNNAYYNEPNVLFRTSLRNTIYDVWSKIEGWEETESDEDWDINWADVGWIRENFDRISFDDHQRINHFRNHYELTRKDLLVKNLKRMKKSLSRSADTADEASSYDFWCTTFVLPAEYGMFLEEFKKSIGSLWIMKPVGKAQGKGIFIFSKLADVSDWKKDHNWKSDGPQAETYVAQKYVENPYTIGGRKFDLRLYVLVTSFSPLVVWQYRTGFARFSFSRYSYNKGEIDNLYMHLTNASIQKNADDYDKKVGCKWPLRELKMYLTSVHGVPAVDKLFYNIQCVITRSLLAVSQTIIQDKHCFELYGYDILIDNDLKPWLLEVNASPALTGDTAADYDLKRNLVVSTTEIVDVEGKLRGSETNVGGFDKIWDNGPVKPSSAKSNQQQPPASRPPGYSTYLGTTFETKHYDKPSKKQSTPAI